MSAPTSEKTSKHDLPPSRPKEDRGVRKDVRPPFSRVSFSTFLNGLTAVLLAILGWYVYNATTMALGIGKGSASGGIPRWLFGIGGSRSSVKSKEPKSRHGEQGETGVERRIEELAKALGMPDSELSAAIAVVVKEHVPPASLSSLAAQAKESGGNRVVDILVGQDHDQKQRGGGVTGTLGGMVGDEVPGADMD